MFHACVQRFDVTGNLEKFWELNWPQSYRDRTVVKTQRGTTHKTTRSGYSKTIL
jgi:hypothetical protein